MTNQKTFTSLCKTILVLCLFSLFFTSCSSKEKAQSNDKYASMSDEEIIAQQTGKSKATQKKYRERARVAGAELQSEEEIAAVYQEQTRIAAESEKEMQAKWLAIENADEIAAEKAAALEDERRRLRNEKILVRASSDEQNIKEKSYLNVADKKLTESIVSSFLSDFEQLVIKEQDIIKMSEFFSSDAVITVSTPFAANPMVMSKNQYLKATSESWATVENYKYDLLNRKVTITGSSATVISEQKESMDMFGQTLEMLTNENTEIVIRDGRLLITKVVANVSEL